MSTIRKKDFINLVLENISDVEEMAIRPKKVQAPRKNEKEQLIIPEFVSVWKNDNPTKPGEDGVPDAWIINKEKTVGTERLVVPMGNCKDITEFINNNEEWLESIGALYGLTPELHYCVSDVNPTGTWKFQPRNKRFDTSFVHRGVFESAGETIKRYMHNAIRYYLDNREMRNFFESVSIPLIKPNDPKHLDRYGVVNNQEVNYQTHAFAAYEDENQFLRFIIARMGGTDIGEDYKSYHLARQFNKNYQNWKETKKQTPNYEGKTDKYFLEKYGFDPDNTSMVVRTDLKITGRLIEDKYNWTIEFVVKYGSKLKEDKRIKDGLKLDKDIIVNKSTSIIGDEPFTDKIDIDNFTIVHDMNIRASFESAMTELVNRIKSEIEPIHAMTRLSTVS